MDDELKALTDETDTYVVAQAARTHAQRAEEKAAGLETEIASLREHGWTKTDHDGFWEAAKAADEKVRHRLNVLLTFSAIALALILGLVGWTIWHLDTVDERTDRQIATIVETAKELCENNNAQLSNTRELYRQLSEVTASPSVAVELQNAAAELPEPVNCSVFEVSVKP